MTALLYNLPALAAHGVHMYVYSLLEVAVMAALL